jgi:uncharacterized alkaline shock family protein YloU
MPEDENERSTQSPGETGPSTAGEESAAAPSVAEDVVAAYVADAVRCVPGVAGLRSSPWRSLGHKTVGSREGVVVRMQGPQVVEIAVHLKVAWGAVIPEVARQVQDMVRRRLQALLDMEVAGVVVHVDEVEAPSEPA